MSPVVCRPLETKLKVAEGNVDFTYKTDILRPSSIFSTVCFKVLPSCICILSTSSLTRAQSSSDLGGIFAYRFGSWKVASALPLPVPLLFVAGGLRGHCWVCRSRCSCPGWFACSFGAKSLCFLDTVCMFGKC